MLRNGRSAIILPLILIGAIIVGILGLLVLQGASANNRVICNYLGGLWERRETDQAHRCYTYEEYYE